MIPSSYPVPAVVDHFRPRALQVGILSLVLCLAGTSVVGIERCFFSYLVAFVFWVGVAVGSLALAMLHHMTGGNWGVVIRRLLEAATRTLPLMFLLFLPLALGLGYIYEWADPIAVAANHILEHKHPYLNTPFFLIRAVMYFAVWLCLAYFLNKWSLEQDATGDHRVQKKLQMLSGPGLLLYGLTVTFASIDWVMSLDPEWFSTIFGIMFMGGQGLSALAFAIAVLVLLSNDEPLAGVVKPSHLHDLGKLLLAFVMLWAYFNFSQFLIIWAGNLPEEIPWYLRRIQGNWKWVGLLLTVFHFALPFFLLLSRDLKRQSRKIALVATMVMFMRFVDIIWLMSPEFSLPFHQHGGASSRAGVLMDFVALIGIGGIWAWAFLSQLRGRPLLPIHDPNWEEAESSSS